MKKQFNVRLPQNTQEQIEKLRATYGTVTQVLILAIDRLARAENHPKEEEEDNKETEI